MAFSCTTTLSLVCVSLLLGCLFAPAIGTQDFFLDQIQSGVVTTFKIPQHGVWQSFTPAWTGNLTKVEAYIGPEKHEHSYECIHYHGILTILHGQPRKTLPYFDEDDVMYTQEVRVTSCECDEDGCASWQQFELDGTVPVMGDHMYTLHFSAHRLSNHPFRIGLYVADAYLRGTNNFRAPGYDFSFKTYLDTQNPDDIVYVEDSTPLPPVDQDEDKDSETLPISIPIIVACAVFLLGVLLVAILVVQRRRRSRSKTFAVGDMGANDSSAAAWARSFEQSLDAKPQKRTLAYSTIDDAKFESFDDNFGDVYELMTLKDNFASISAAPEAWGRPTSTSNPPTTVLSTPTAASLRRTGSYDVHTAPGAGEISYKGGRLWQPSKASRWAVSEEQAQDLPPAAPAVEPLHNNFMYSGAGSSAANSSHARTAEMVHVSPSSHGISMSHQTRPATSSEYQSFFARARTAVAPLYQQSSEADHAQESPQAVPADFLRFDDAFTVQETSTDDIIVDGNPLDPMRNNYLDNN